ncbi:DNA-binding response regulator [Noviherbaspirillum cavernae]|uniref:DNA-binding response regulator n=1 Tax=Noviherbaspirillum cavernae TaxID=2320862 RepID=A0A418X431_9BURK|nr:response regulator transcription factor [Noviherbaspirillum cavernae]RJG07228.1 DNA-binding response regulator [Noviherbaspirillum cavernae]
MRIALLDNDARQTRLIGEVLTNAGHTCHPGTADTLEQLQSEGIDMLIVDQKMPSAAVLQWARSHMPENFPVLYVASRTDEDHIVEAMSRGASDYIIKPLRRGELLTRVHTLLRRAYPDRQGPEQLQFGHYIFEPRTNRIHIAGHQVSVTHKEFELALLFFRHLGRPLSRAYILDAIWSADGNVPSRTMDTHVSRVRTKLQLRPENGYRLLPVYSFGYRLELLPDSAQQRG